MVAPPVLKTDLRFSVWTMTWEQGSQVISLYFYRRMKHLEMTKYGELVPVLMP